MQGLCFRTRHAWATVHFNLTTNQIHNWQKNKTK